MPGAIVAAVEAVDSIANLDVPPGFDLRAGFESFVEAAKRLEQSYAELKQRADAIDSQLQAANARLAAGLAEREAVFAALPVGVVSLDAGGAPRVCNPEARRLIEIVAAADVDLLELESGEHSFADCNLRVDRVDLPEDDGSLLVVEDRTRVVSLEHEVDRLDRLAGLSELALGVAHEIKNPLNGVMGFAELLERHDDPVAIRRCARNVAVGMRQVDDIVKSMLAFARPRDGEPIPSSIAAIVAAATTEAGVAKSCIQLAGETVKLADALTLTRVLTNLFRNSFEAGSRLVQVCVSVQGESLRLDVQDDGPGVPSELGERVFEPFFSTKRSGSDLTTADGLVAGRGGHGLGLALVARILSFVGGSIELVDGGGEPGLCGARFRVTMPLLERVCDAG